MQKFPPCGCGYGWRWLESHCSSFHVLGLDIKELSMQVTWLITRFNLYGWNDFNAWNILKPQTKEVNSGELNCYFDTASQVNVSVYSMHMVKDKRAAGQLKCAHGALPASVTIFNDFDVSTFINVSYCCPAIVTKTMLQAWSHCHLQTDSAYPGQYANIMQTSIWFHRWRLQPWTTHSNCDLLFSLFLNGRKGFATSLACALPEVLEGNPSHRWLMSRFFYGLLVIKEPLTSHSQWGFSEGWIFAGNHSTSEEHMRSSTFPSSLAESPALERTSATRLLPGHPIFRGDMAR